MFPGAAKRIGQILEDVEFKVVVNLGSSTARFFKGKQPYIWEEIMEPLLRRGNALFNVDQKQQKGVHLVGDAETWCMPNFADVVICCNLLEHTEQPNQIINCIYATLRPGGLLVMESPADYPYHADPIDTMFRLKTKEEWNEFMGDRWKLKSCEIITWAEHPGQTSSLVVYQRRD